MMRDISMVNVTKVDFSSLEKRGGGAPVKTGAQECSQYTFGDFFCQKIGGGILNMIIKCCALF